MNNTQLIKEMNKTDKIVTEFLDNCKTFVEYKDRTNDGTFIRISELVKTLLEELDE